MAVRLKAKEKRAQGPKRDLHAGALNHGSQILFFTSSFHLLYKLIVIDGGFSGEDGLKIEGSTRLWSAFLCSES